MESGSACIVTRFGLVDGELRYSRIGRRTCTAAAVDVVSIDETSYPEAGATVWLRSGTTLYFPFEHLPNARELVARLQAARRTDNVIEGCLNRRGIANRLVYQWLVTCLLLPISVLGYFCIAIFVNPKNMVANPDVFLYLGSVLLVLCASGFYFAVLHYWIGCVHSFRWDGHCLQYRTVMSRTLQQRLSDEIEHVSVRRPNSSQAEAGTWRSVRFRGGDRLKLQVGTLQNADALFAALKAEVERRASVVASVVLPSVTDRHALWPTIHTCLVEGEQVYWLGRPVYGKLWSEISAEMIFGLLPGSMGLGILALGCHLLAKGDFLGCLAVAFGLFFGGIGASMLAAPWKYRSMLRDTVYAVTSQRIIILNGLSWGSQSAVQPRGREIESFDCGQARLFEVVGRRRDIILGGQWIKGRRNRRYWVNFGFLAVDDPTSAEWAIRCLLATAK